MRRFLFIAVIFFGTALAAIAGCSSVQNNEVPSAPRTSSPAPANPAPPQSNAGFLNPATLQQSVATEQSQALAAAPASDYDSTDDAPVSVSCHNTSSTTFTCTGTDTDGDAGAADNVTVSADGSSWSDSGMTWTGPDVAATSGYTVAAVTGWTGN
jgi:hypothetical protein